MSGSESQYIRPESLDSALEARREHPEYVVLAGGTDLLVGAKHAPEPAGIIDLFGLQGLTGITAANDGAITIGAATTFARIRANELIQRELPCLAAAAAEIGALQIQSRATIGGNIGTSSPVGDSLPVLLALDAEIELASAGSARLVPYADYCTGYRQTAIAEDEIIVSVRVPPRVAGTRQFWRKVGTRRAQSISKVAAAATLRVENGVIAHARVGLGAVADRPIRAERAEAEMLGELPGEALAARVRAAIAEEISPIDDVRSTAAYRLMAAQNAVARFVLQLAEEPS